MSINSLIAQKVLVTERCTAHLGPQSDSVSLTLFRLYWIHRKTVAPGQNLVVGLFCGRVFARPEEAQLTWPIYTVRLPRRIPVPWSCYRATHGFPGT